MQASSKDEALSELLAPILAANPHLNKKQILQTILDREKLGSTGLGGGVAIPHGKFEGLERIAASFGRSQKGIDFSSMDNKPAYLFFMLVAPKDCAGDHLKALARISRIFKAMDNNSNHTLDVDDFRWGLIDYGISITKEEASQVL